MFQGDYNVCFMLQHHAPCVVKPACFRRGLSGVRVRVMRLFWRYIKAVSLEFKYTIFSVWENNTPQGVALFTVCWPRPNNKFLILLYAFILII